MAYEYPAGTRILRLTRIRRRWVVEFNGRQSGNWPSPDAAAIAAARHKSGLDEWDREAFEVPDDLLEWRPLGDSL
jgi:hypothetical protein